MDKVKLWYDGYSFMGDHVYNPFDILQETALAQMKSKGYSEKYQTKGKKIILIGIGFSSEEKNVTEFLIDDF